MRNQFLVAVLMTLVAAVEVSAQRPMGRPGPGSGRRPPLEALIERWNRMTPEERDRALKNVPPKRRETIERRLEEYNRLSPEQKERLRVFRELPPEKQEQMRAVYRSFRELPEDRRRPMAREIRNIRSMSAEARHEHLNSEDVNNRFSSDERKMLGQLAEFFDGVDEMKE